MTNMSAFMKCHRDARKHVDRAVFLHIAAILDHDAAPIAPDSGTRTHIDMLSNADIASHGGQWVDKGGRVDDGDEIPETVDHRGKYTSQIPGLRAILTEVPQQAGIINFVHVTNFFELVASIHNLRIEGISGKEINLSQFKGKKLMIVNVASECDFTPQYGQLEELYETYQDTLAILGCPCNDFGAQEPLSEDKIASFCQTMYQVSFPLSKKINIRTAPVHPLYQWLTQAVQNGMADTEVEWNFQKYAISPEGQWQAVFSAETSPLDERIIHWIEAT
jgi:glutathione peroxidase